PAQRVGVLTQGSWLVSHPTASQRGRWIYDALYCQSFPPPPELPVHVPEVPTEGRSGRQIQEQTTASAPCMTCHTLIDPPGFLYEHYDNLGHYRTVDNGQTVFARANVQLPGYTGPLDGAAGLARDATDSCEGQTCFAQRWLQAATGVDDPEAAARDEVASAFRAGRLGLRDLIVAVAQSPLFLRP